MIFSGKFICGFLTDSLTTSPLGRSVPHPKGLAALKRPRARALLAHRWRCGEAARAALRGGLRDALPVVAAAAGVFHRTCHQPAEAPRARECLAAARPIVLPDKSVRTAAAAERRRARNRAVAAESEAAHTWAPAPATRAGTPQRRPRGAAAPRPAPAPAPTAGTPRRLLRGRPALAPRPAAAGSAPGAGRGGSTWEGGRGFRMVDPGERRARGQ